MLKCVFLTDSRSKAESGNPLENFLKVHFYYTSSSGKEQERVGLYSIYGISSKILIVSLHKLGDGSGVCQF